MTRIAVVGAGIVGASIATWLIEEGHDVTAFEREPEALSASVGNASLIALPEIAPIASPGILAAVPKWLLDPLGPLTVVWRDLPAMTPWLIAFLASATPGNGIKARAALASLMHTALLDHEAIGRMVGLTGHLRQTGFISVHDSEAGIVGALREAELVKQALAHDYERLSPQAARALVPQLEGPFVGAIHQPVYRTASNPLTILKAHRSHIAAKARFVAAEVTGIVQRDRIEVQTAGGASELFDQVVVAGGVWSRELVRRLGLKVLLETERGYNTTYTNLGWNLPTPVGFADHGFVATPLVDALRVGGAVELAKPETPPNYGRAKAMRQKMRRYVPSLPEGGIEWMGCRPSTPDSLPVISRHPGDRRIVFAFGHGHLGLTLSAVTARLVSGLLDETTTALPAFDIRRFQ